MFFKLSESKVEVIEEIKPIENVMAALPANKGNEEDKKRIQKDEEVEKVEISAPKKIVSIVPSLPAPEKIEAKPVEKVKT